MVALDEASCRLVVEEMLDIIPLGDWVRASNAGDVTYDAGAAAACVAALDTAACGQPARNALWDSTCFGFAAPSGGPEQRSMFHRTRPVGSTCAPVRDGVGAAFYGSCDPTTSFCCYEVPGRTGCQYPFDAAGVPRSGTCAPVAAVGAACGIAAPLKLCATGINCADDTQTCVAPVATPLAVGERCLDASFNQLGECQGSFCDALGTSRCEPQRANGAACTGGDECVSGLCNSVCVPMTICTGAPTMPPPMTSNESCTNAPTLASASTASPLTGYTSRVAAPFGSANDYNPLGSSALPPACSVVYDARGKDVVYEVTLSPGDRLRVRAELADGKQAGIYLLDTCPGGSWPDFDLTGACGSNEYAVGFCGALGCDAAALDVRYPTTISGQPTAPAKFWLVIDQVAGDTSSGFIVDWRQAP